MVKFIYVGYGKTRTKTISEVFRRLGQKVYDFQEHELYLSARLVKNHVWKIISSGNCIFVKQDVLW